MPAEVQTQALQPIRLRCHTDGQLVTLDWRDALERSRMLAKNAESRASDARSALIALGAHLNEIRQQLAHGHWNRFLDATGINRKRSQRAMRLAADVAMPDGQVDENKIESHRLSFNATAQARGVRPIPEGPLSARNIEIVMGRRPGDNIIQGTPANARARGHLGEDEKPAVERVPAIANNAQHVDDGWGAAMEYAFGEGLRGEGPGQSEAAAVGDSAALNGQHSATLPLGHLATSSTQTKPSLTVGLPARAGRARVSDDIPGQLDLSGEYARAASVARRVAEIMDRKGVDRELMEKFLALASEICWADESSGSQDTRVEDADDAAFEGQDDDFEGDEWSSEEDDVDGRDAVDDLDEVESGDGEEA